MIRVLFSFIKVLIALIIAFTVFSCQLNVKTITGSGNVIKETRNVGGKFTKVSAGNGMEVEIIQSEVVSVEVEADDNLLPHIKTEVNGNTLKITCEYNGFIDVASKKIFVKMPLIEALQTESGANLITQGLVRSAQLDITASSGSSLIGEFEADDLEADSSSGSSIELKGKAISFDASTSSGSSIEATNLIANDVKADASSGSSLLVHAAVSINGKASSGASVEYVGDPKNFSKDESSGGSVTKK